MSREIKFRAWDIKGKEMLVAWPLPTIYPSDVLYSTQSIGVRPDDKRFELMQYTGLHDRNGVEIYEGDIVVGMMYPDKAEIMFDQRFAVFKGQRGTKLMPLGYECEVIGNIYESPELLEGLNRNA